MIASNEIHLIFLEVKTRSANAMVSPLAAVTPQKQRRIFKTAQTYLMHFPTQLQPRIEVMGITVGQDGLTVLQYQYLKNAFTADGIS